MVGGVSIPPASDPLASVMFSVLLIGAASGLLGTFVASRGMAFLRDAVTQAIFPGVIIALLLYAGLLIGAIGVGVLTVMGISLISRSTPVGWGTATGVLLAGTCAGVVLWIARLQSHPTDLTAVLIGNVFGIPSFEVTLIEICSVPIFVILFVFYKELLLVSFDPSLAASQGWPVMWLDRLLLLLLALTVAMSLNLTGTVFLAPFIVTPSATARFWAERFWSAMLLGGFLGAFSATTGLYLSYSLRVPSGAAVVLVASVLFLISFVVAPKRGLLARRFGA